MDFTLRFDLSTVDELANRYVEKNSVQSAEDFIEQTIAPSARRNGMYSREEFLKLCHWKTPRSQPRCAKNADDFIHEVTRIALSAKNERVRIEALRLLDGVDWSTASVLLHFGHAEKYPILDFRALESLSINLPSQYSFEFWWRYVEICRSLADKAGVSMRTLDRALWQYSFEAGNNPLKAAEVNA